METHGMTTGTTVAYLAFIMSQRTRFAVVGAILVGIGCGSADSKSPAGEPATNAAPSDASEIAYKASPATQTEFGVALWTMSVVTVEPWIKGRDATGAVVAELKGTDETASGGTGRTKQYVLRHGKQSVATKMALDMSHGAVVDVRILEDSFWTDPLAKRLLNLLIADLQAGPEASSSPPPANVVQTSTQTNSLKPLDNNLVQGCQTATPKQIYLEQTSPGQGCPSETPHFDPGPCSSLISVALTHDTVGYSFLIQANQPNMPQDMRVLFNKLGRSFGANDRGPRGAYIGRTHPLSGHLGRQSHWG
jgi:hypothetical protein